MKHEIVIRGGEIVDGTGAEPVAGDLAIDEGRITEIGRVEEPGKREIDARGHLVTPGFVDLHTHLDAQIGWDPLMTPVSWHGVTTALMGNCGVTFAPCRPDDRELLASMMETVEDIPKDAILGGLPWDWEGYGGYLDSIERLQPAVNVCGLVGHCAVRFYVMGERAVEDQATEEELDTMARLVARSIDEGACGFSTNRYEPHKLADGRSIPGTFADSRELEEIARLVGPRKGLMQAVGADFEILKTLADTTGGRVLFSYGTAPYPGMGRKQAKELARLCEGRDITAITQVRGSGFTFGLQSNLPFVGETWDRLRSMAFAERAQAVNDGEIAAKLIEEGRASGACRLPMQHCFFMGTEETPDYTVPSDQNVYALSKAAGEHFVETFLRLTRESEGRGLFTFRMFNQSLDELGDLFESEHIFPSLGDAGAHVSQIMDAGWSSFVLSYWVRERALYSIGEGIRRLTSGPARVLGLKDRGVLEVGKRADINVLDATQVAEKQPELVHDFPGGAPRYIQKSKGYRATLVNGTVSLWEGEHTGDRAGTVLRHQA